MIKMISIGSSYSTSDYTSTVDALCQLMSRLADGRFTLVMSDSERKVVIRALGVSTLPFITFEGDEIDMRPLVTAAWWFWEGRYNTPDRVDSGHVLCAKMALLVGLGLTGRNTFYWGMKFDQLSDLVAAIKLAEESGLSFLEVVRTAA